MSELKPCPFCGGEAELRVCDATGCITSTNLEIEISWGKAMSHYMIFCKKCRIRTGAYLTKRGVFTAWNRRTNNEQIL